MGEIIVIVALAVAVGLAIRSIRREHQKGGCCGDCANCHSCGK